MTAPRQTELLPWLLFNIILLTGVIGEDFNVYSSVGTNTSLPCHRGAYPSCHKIIWMYSKLGLTVSHVLVNYGKVKQKSGKLRVGPNCSLQVNNLTTADTGLYVCRLYHYESDQRYFTDASLHLSILSISASSPVAELKTGATVTLLCELQTDGPCRTSLRVTWVNETGIPLQGDRYTTSKSQCSSSLTVTLERSDRNRKWRCQLTEEGKLMTSHSYTTVFSDENMTEVWIGSGVAACVAVVLIVIWIVICKRRTAQRVTAFDHDPQKSQAVTDQSKVQEQNEDTVTYAEVNPAAAGKRKPHRDTVESQTEYAAIKGSQYSVTMETHD